MEELEIILEVEDNGEQNITISEENIELVYPMLEDLEVTPSKEEQNFKSKMYGYNNVKVKQVTSDVDENIKAENIRVGTTILDVEGSFNGVDTSDATATSDDILEGKTAYVNNTMITGAMEEYDGTYTGNTSTPVRQFSSIEEMNNSTVNNTGDLCVVYNEGYTDLEVGKTYTNMYLPQTIELNEPITSTKYIFFANSTNVDKTPHVRITPTSIVFYRPVKVVLTVYRAEAMNTVKYTSTDGKTYTRTDSLDDCLPVSDIYSGYHTSITVQSGNYDILTQMFKVYSKTYGGSYKYTENDTWTALNDNILNVTPSKDEQIYTGEYGEVHIEGDEDLISANIKEGATIFGVQGTLSVGDIKITDGRYLFYYDARTDYLNDILSACTNLADVSYMFCYCRTVTDLDLSHITTTGATDFRNVFSYASNLTTLDISGFTTNAVTNMSYMFNSCSKLIKLDLSNFNTYNVTNMNSMFASCSVMTELDVSSFNTAKVTTMNYMFSGCNALTDLDLSSFNMSKVTNINGMFGYCRALKNLKFGTNLGKGYTQKSSNYSNYTLDLSDCTELTHDSLMSVINNLYDITSVLGSYKQKLVLGTANKAKLTAEEIAIATNKGWNVT